MWLLLGPRYCWAGCERHRVPGSVPSSPIVQAVGACDLGPESCGSNNRELRLKPETLVSAWFAPALAHLHEVRRCTRWGGAGSHLR
jgi:hypothetical protein